MIAGGDRLHPDDGVEQLFTNGLVENVCSDPSAINKTGKSYTTKQVFRPRDKY